MEKLARLLALVMGVFAGLFALTVVVYYFNLDMKAAAMAQPILDKWYDRRKREPMP